MSRNIFEVKLNEQLGEYDICLRDGCVHKEITLQKEFTCIGADIEVGTINEKISAILGIQGDAVITKFGNTPVIAQGYDVMFYGIQNHKEHTTICARLYTHD